MENNYAYSLSKTKRSSSDLGKCEVCNKDGNEYYLLVQYKRYLNKKRKYGYGLTLYKCFSKFGHKKCLSKLT